MLKYVRGESLQDDHWGELFSMLQMPHGMTLAKLTFGDILAVADNIVAKADQIKVNKITIRNFILPLSLYSVSF